ncbi:MAG: hypothetical protein PGN16_01650 [Sphingomonas phyllosphaerae]|uniref:hypothetical protein n=1 Tax=Sphingomonas phyllosphaerae TaxID=257003 RepID=UPI002FF53978
MLIAHELAGMRILIAHEDSFQRAYLATVMTAAGAIVIDRPATAGAWWPNDPPLDAAVLSQVMQATDARPLIDAAARGALAVLVLHSTATLPSPVVSPLRSLATPYAAFQVVDALCDMLASRADRGTPS